MTCIETFAMLLWCGQLMPHQRLEKKPTGSRQVPRTAQSERCEAIDTYEYDSIGLPASGSKNASFRNASFRHFIEFWGAKPQTKSLLFALPLAPSELEVLSEPCGIFYYFLQRR